MQNISRINSSVSRSIFHNLSKTTVGVEALAANNVNLQAVRYVAMYKLLIV